MAEVKCRKGVVGGILHGIICNSTMIISIAVDISLSSRLLRITRTIEVAIITVAGAVEEITIGMSSNSMGVAAAVVAVAEETIVKEAAVTKAGKTIIATVVMAQAATTEVQAEP